MYTQGFDGIPQEISKDAQLIQQTDAVTIMQSPETRMFDFYFEKNKLSNDFFRIDKKQRVKEINEYLTKKETASLFYGWADFARLENVEFLKDKYKYLINEKQFFNSEYYLFSNNPILKNADLSTKSRRSITKIPEGNKQILYKSDKPGYSKSIDIKLDSLILDNFDVINLKARVIRSESDVDALLVFDLKDADGNSIIWSASKLQDYYLEQDLYYNVYISKRLLSIYPFSEGSILKTYIWKRDTSLLEIENIEVYLTKINPIEMGLFNKIH